MVLVKFFATLREITGVKEEELSGTTVREILEELYEKYGTAFRKELEKRSMILVNGKNIQHLSGIDTKLQPDDVVSIFPPAGGG